MQDDYLKSVASEWNFGADRALANKLKKLVLSGKKTATTGLYQENKKIPSIGDYAAICDSDNKRFCIVRYVDIQIKPFLEVGYEHVKKEGEGHATLDAWRRDHRDFFRKLSHEFSDRSLVTCEEFKLIKKID